MRKLLTAKSIALILILAVSTVILLYLLLNKQAVPTFYDFIDRFYDAERVNFNNGAEIERYLPDRSYNIGYLLLPSFTEVFSRNTTILCKNGQFNKSFPEEVTDGGIRLSFYNTHRMEYLLTFKRKNAFEYHSIKLVTGNKSEVTVSKYTNNNEEIIDKFSFPLQAKKIKNTFQVIFFSDYSVISANKKILFQQKDGSLKTSGKIGFSYKSLNPNNLIFTAKLALIDNKMKADLLNRIKNNRKDLPEHKFSVDDKVWNSLYSEHLLNINGQKSPFLRRIKIGTTTRRAIYFRLNSSLTYRIRIPSDSVFHFSLTAVPKFIYRKERLRFVVEILNSEGVKVEKRIEYSFKDFTDSFHEFQSISVDLSPYSDQSRAIRLKAETVDGQLKQNEDRILIACASPVIYPKKITNDPNVILIVLDTLAADHLGCYGYRRNTSPNIDEFARKSTIFKNTIANGPRTLPSHMSMFSSLFPNETGYQRRNSRGEARFAQNVKLFPEYLKAAGYMNIAITGNSYVGAIFGFDRGFDSYFEKREDIGVAVDRVIDTLEKNSQHKFFLFFHSYEVHEPYTHNYYLSETDSNSTDKDVSIARYDSGIRYTDKHIGRFLKWLEKKGLLENSMVIITSDHGEDFDNLKLIKSSNEDQYVGTHGRTLYDNVLRVPLIIGGMQQFNNRGVIEKQVSLIDLMPTILSTTGIQQSENNRGIDLLPVILTDKRTDRIAYSEGTVSGKKFSIRSNVYKVIKTILGSKHKIKEKYECFNLKADPMEKMNVFNKDDEISQKYSSRLNQIIESVMIRKRRLILKKGTSPPEIKSLEKELRNLGYLQ